MGHFSLNIREIRIPISQGVFRVAGEDYDDNEPNSLDIGAIITDRQSLHIGVRPAVRGPLLLRLRDRVVPAMFVHEIIVTGTKLWVGSGDLSTGLMFVVKPGSYQLSLWRNESDLTGGSVVLGIAAVGSVGA